MHGHSDMKALRTAIPYIRAYAGHTFVIKLGGGLCEPGPVLDNVIEQIALLSTLGIRIVVVHGGGEQLSALESRLGHQPRIVAGRRVTDDQTLELAKMTFAGTINTNLIAAFRKFDVPAVGLTGVDGRLITAARRPPQQVHDPSTGDTLTVDYGNVGDLTDVTPAILEQLLAQRNLPVIASLAADGAGHVYNVNADTIASRVAIALRAVKYFLLTAVDGVLLNLNDPNSLQTYLDVEQLDGLEQRGVISGGMLPKLAACKVALRGGVPRVHIVNGTVHDALLTEVFTNEGSGTLLVLKRENGKHAS
ncbi:MAG: acetylglutamate kinase [Phycisphaerae bacterium]